jgi:hypothetical protein
LPGAVLGWILRGLEDYIAGKNDVSIEEVLQQAIGLLEKGRWGQLGMKRVARILKVKGFERMQQPIGDGRKWRYRPTY